MFVYLAKFEKRKGLCKIGVAKEVRSRLAQLESTHGPLVSFQKFKIGRGYIRLEKFIHERFAEHCADLPKCDGYTEFFKDLVEDEAVKVLSAMSTTLTESEAEISAKEQAQLAPEIRNRKSELACVEEEVEKCNAEITAAQKFIEGEHKRIKIFLIKLIQNRQPNNFELMDSHQVIVGNGYPILHMSGALELGFKKEEVVTAAYNKLKAEGRQRVTCWRLRTAYDVYIESGGFGEGGHRKMSEAKKAAAALREKLKRLKKKKQKLEEAAMAAKQQGEKE